jgi:WD40 repeat protein
MGFYMKWHHPQSASLFVTFCCLFLALGWAVLWPAIRIQTAHAASTPAFSTDIAPILQKNCLACHSSAANMGGLVMESYDLLMKGGKDGPAIVPGKSEQSRLIQMLEGKVQPRMPFGTDPLPASDIATLKAWIDTGAKGPAAGEAAQALAPLAIPEIKVKVPVVSPVVSLKFSPDGAILASGGYKEVRMIDPSTGKVIRTLEGHTDYVRSIVFSPDGKRLLAGGGPPQQWGEIQVWDVATGGLLRSMQGHKDCIYSVALSPDGKLVASGSYDKAVKIWDAQTGQELKTLLDHIDAVFAVAFSPDGKLLASGSQDRTVKIWNVASGERLYTLSDALDGITSIAFSPSGEYLAAAGYDNSIHIWKISEKEGSLVQSLIADEDSILQIVWSPEGKTVITSSSDGSIRFRDAVTLDPLAVLNSQSDWVDALAISPDGKWLAAGRCDGTLTLYDTRSYKPTLGPLVAFECPEPASGAMVAQQPKEAVGSRQ